MTETWKETSTSYTNPQMSVASLWKLSQPTHLHPHFHWLTFTGNSSPYTPPSRPSSSLAAATQGFAPLLASALLLWVLLGSDLDLIRQPRSLMLCVCVHTQTLSHFSRLCIREDWTRGGGTKEHLPKGVKDSGVLWAARCCYLWSLAPLWQVCSIIS